MLFLDQCSVFSKILGWPKIRFSALLCENSDVMLFALHQIQVDLIFFWRCRLVYQSGELVVYGSTGVCRVEGFSKPNLPGADRQKDYYILKPLFQDGTIYTPVDSKVFMRPVISRQEADRLIDMIPSLEAEGYFSQNTQDLNEHYKEMIQSHDCADLIELAMSIYSKKQYVLRQKHKFGQVDERYMKKAEELLYGEFSVALEIPKEEVPSYIAARVKEGKKK